MALLPLADKLSQETTKETRFNAIVIQFGGGYSARMANGTNARRDVWNLSWTRLSETEKNTLENFFDGIGNWNTFEWTAPGDSTQKKWRVSETYSVSALAGDIYQISVQVQEEFDL